MPPVRSQSAKRTRLPVIRSSENAVCVAMVEAPEPGLALENAIAWPSSASAGASGRNQPPQPGNGLALRRQVERSVEKFARSGPQGLQNDLRIVLGVQPHHVHRRGERRDPADQLHGGCKIGR